MKGNYYSSIWTNKFHTLGNPSTWLALLPHNDCPTPPKRNKASKGHREASLGLLRWLACHPRWCRVKSTTWSCDFQSNRMASAVGCDKAKETARTASHTGRECLKYLKVIEEQKQKNDRFQVSGFSSWNPKHPNPINADAAKKKPSNLGSDRGFDHLCSVRNMSVGSSYDLCLLSFVQSITSHGRKIRNVSQ